MFISSQRPYFLLVLVAMFVLAPAIGGAILRLSLGVLRTRNVTYVRCWVAYLVAYLGASVLLTLIVTFAQSNFSSDATDGQWVAVMATALIVHLIVVPIILKTNFLRAMLAHCIALVVYGGALIVVTFPLIWYARAEARRVLAGHNLKMIGLAMQFFHDHERAFPAQALRSKDGRALLSWRVLILPYVEQLFLHNRFKWDEPWNGSHNISLLPDMPYDYADPGIPVGEPYATRYQVFLESDPPTHEAQSPPFNALTQGTGSHRSWAGRATQTGPSAADFTDGTSNTILAAEAAEPVPWSKPADMLYSPSSNSRRMRKARKTPCQQC